METITVYVHSSGMIIIGVVIAFVVIKSLLELIP